MAEGTSEVGFAHVIDWEPYLLRDIVENCVTCRDKTSRTLPESMDACALKELIIRKRALASTTLIHAGY